MTQTASRLLNDPVKPISPLVSVIIPHRPAMVPERALEWLTQARFPGDELEVILASGLSPSQQRNEAAKIARGQILYFLDDDSYVAADAISQGLRVFADPRVTAVGGPAVTHAGASCIENCIGEVTSSLFGGLITRARNRPIGKIRPVRGDELQSCNLMIRKDAYLSVSGMDPRLYPSEDPELIKRLRARQALLYYHPGMLVSRERRKTVVEFSKQFLRYGQGRGLHIMEGSDLTELAYLMPSVFLLYLLIVPVCSVPCAVAPLWLYLGLALVSALAIGARRRSLLMGMCAAFLCMVMHLAYALGLIAGLAQRMRGPVQEKLSPVALTILSPRDEEQPLSLADGVQAL